MNKNTLETILGAVVLGAAVLFLFFGLSFAGLGNPGGYDVNARFSGIGGLQVGDKVVISGVRVGEVKEITLDPMTYLANVRLSVDEGVELPADTAAFISSESLLGGLYMQLEPGAAEEMISPGGTLQYTQAPQNLEQLLGQFIFSIQDENEEGSEGSGDGNGGNTNSAGGNSDSSSYTDPLADM